MTGSRWLVRPTALADADFRAIISWTEENFGTRQARSYARRLLAAIERLERGPHIMGAVDRSDVEDGLRQLRISARAHRGRHVLLFRATLAEGIPTIVIVRILHDAMDPARHLADDDPHA